MKIEIKRESSEVFFSDIDVGEVFCYGGEIYMKTNMSCISDDNAYDFSDEVSTYFDSTVKVVPAKEATLIVKI